MGKWGLIFGAVSVAAGLSFVYMAWCIRRFGAFRKLAQKKKWLGLAASFAVTGAVFGLFCLLMSLVNAVMILLHAVLFFMLFGLIFRIVRRIRKKDFRFNLQGWTALTVTAVYLCIGWYLCHNVWQTDYSISTAKNIGTLKAALIADSHLSTLFDGDGFAEHLKTIAEQSPDILFIAGDFIDDSTVNEDMYKACEALGELDLKYGVWYCYGNHDKGYFRKKDYTESEFEMALRDNGIHVMADDIELVDDRFYVAGRKDGSRDADRLTIDELLAGADKDKYIIVLDHQPNDYEAEAASAADLVLSGHTHGGQLIPATFVGEWMGMNDKTYGHEKRGDTDFIVTSGIADWEILFKTGTKSEHVIIDIGQ